MTVRVRNVMSALRGFLRGFLGWSATPGALPRQDDPTAARRALEERASRRPSCC